MERDRDKDRREHACGKASGHKGRNLRHRCDVHAWIHPRDVLRHAKFNLAHWTLAMMWAACMGRCNWLQVMSNATFPQAGTKNNGLPRCGEPCPRVSIIRQYTSIWIWALLSDTPLPHSIPRTLGANTKPESDCVCVYVCVCVCMWRVCVSCTSAITLGYSSAACIDFLIGKLDTQSSSLPPHPPVCWEEKLAECSLARRADSSSFSCHLQSSASVIKGFHCVQGNLTGWFSGSSVSFLPCPSTCHVALGSFLSVCVVTIQTSCCQTPVFTFTEGAIIAPAPLSLHKAKHIKHQHLAWILNYWYLQLKVCYLYLTDQFQLVDRNSHAKVRSTETLAYGVFFSFVVSQIRSREQTQSDTISCVLLTESTDKTLANKSKDQKFKQS